MLTGGAVRGTGTLCGPFVQDPELSARLVAAHECSEGAASGLRRDEALIAFTDHLFARYVRPVRPDDAADTAPRAVQRAREFLDANIDTRISLQDLAGVTGLPPSRLLRAFARAVGMSPHAYQRQVRLRHATTLIRGGHADQRGRARRRLRRSGALHAPVPADDGAPAGRVSAGLPRRARAASGGPRHVHILETT